MAFNSLCLGCVEPRSSIADSSFYKTRGKANDVDKRSNKTVCLHYILLYKDRLI